MAQNCRQILMVEVRRCGMRQQIRSIANGCPASADTNVRTPPNPRLLKAASTEMGSANMDVASCPWHEARRRNSTLSLNSDDVFVDHRDRVKSFDDIPGPKPWPIFGGLHHHFPGGKYHGMEVQQTTAMQQAEYGDICKEVIIPGTDIVHLFDPDDIETMYRNEGSSPQRDAFFMLSHYNKKYNNNVQGLLTSQSETWCRFRKNCQHKLMRPKSVTAYMPEQQLVADDLLKRIYELRDQTGEVADMKQDLYKFGAESVGVVCFNRRLGALSNHAEDSEAAKFIRAVNVVMDICSKEFKIVPFWKIFPTPLFRQLGKAQNFIRELAFKYSHESVVRAQKMLDIDKLDGENGDLVPYLMTQTNLKPAEVVTLISELIFAGVDTTSHFLAFCLYALAKNPDKQQTLFEEVNANFPNKSPASGNKLANLPYMKAVFKETSRLYPVAPGTCRTTHKDMVCSGYNIPAGTFLAVHFDWIGKQAKYFPEPNSFRPERWLRGVATAPIHPFAQLPFGHGARSCVGRRFAEQEASLAIMKILQHFKIEYNHGELEIRQSTTYAPASPLRFRFVRRE